MSEVRAKLSVAFDADIVESVLGRLRQRRLVDDARVIQSLMQSNVGRRAVSLDTLRRRCAERGAEEGALEQLDRAVDPPIDELLARYGDDPAYRPRAYRFLLARGFTEDEAVAAVERRFGTSA